MRPVPGRLLGACCLATLPSWAVAAAPCPGADTRGENLCLQEDLNRAEAELARYVAAAVGSIQQDDRSDAVLADLRKGQAAWTEYRKAECDAVTESWLPGTIAVAQGLICERRLTEARTHELWSDFLTHPDSTPPILPEPMAGTER